MAAIAEVHGGSARLEPPAPDRRGATFVVDLPLLVEADASSAESVGPKIG